MKRSKRIILLSLVMILALALAACGSGNNASENTPTATPNTGSTATPKPAESTPAPTPPAEPVELTFYTPHSNSEEYFNATYGDALREKFPNFTFKFLNIQTGGPVDQLIVNKTPVDLIYATPGFVEDISFVHGFAYDMSDLIKKYQVDLSSFNPAFDDLLATAFGGKVFFLPVQADVNVIYYNKDTFDKFGMKYPTDDITWDELIEYNKRVTVNDNGTQYFGLRPAFQRALSIPIIEQKADGTILPTINTDERWKVAIRDYMIPLVAPDAAVRAMPASWNEFYNGTLSMIGAVPASMPSVEEQLKNVNFDIVPMPKFKDGSGLGLQPTITNMMIANISKHKDEAMQVLQYIVSPEHQKRLALTGTGPVLKDIDVQQSLGQNSYFKDKNWQAAFHNEWGAVTYFGAIPKQLYDINNKFIKMIVNEGEFDYNTILRQAEEESLLKLQELKDIITVEGGF